MSAIAILASPGTLVEGKEIPLDESEVHHLRVRRVAPGTAAVCYDGDGGVAEGIVMASGREFAFRSDTVTRHPRPARLVLAVGGGDKDHFMLLAEKCTELGVTHLIPLETERSVTVETRLRPGAIDKVRRRAREACKQCGNPWAASVAEFTTIDRLAEQCPGTRWLIAEHGGSHLPTLDARAEIGWIIGPEGGFTASESGSLHGTLRAEAVTLGAHLLRFETAAIAAATLTADRRDRAGES